MPLPVGLNALCPADPVAGKRNFLEAVAGLVVESEISADQKISIGRLAKRGARGGRNPLRRSEFLEAFPIVSKDAVLRAHPKEARTVLIYLADRKVSKPFRAPEIAEAILLCGHCAARKYRKDRGAYTGGTSHNRKNHGLSCRLPQIMFMKYSQIPATALIVRDCARRYKARCTIRKRGLFWRPSGEICCRW